MAIFALFLKKKPPKNGYFGSPEKFKKKSVTVMRLIIKSNVGFMVSRGQKGLNRPGRSRER